MQYSVKIMLFLNLFGCFIVSLSKIVNPLMEGCRFCADIDWYLKLFHDMRSPQNVLSKASSILPNTQKNPKSINPP